MPKLNDILDEVNALDDPDLEWPKKDLLYTLALPAVARNSICEWHHSERNTASLNQIFELLISSDEDPRTGYLVSRALDFRSVGRKSVLESIYFINTIKFAPKCMAAWRAKHTKFSAAHRMKGSSDYASSFPLTKEGTLMARFKGGGLHRPRKPTSIP
jgi:hypothetical protein